MTNVLQTLEDDHVFMRWQERRSKSLQVKGSYLITL